MPLLEEGVRFPTSLDGPHLNSFLFQSEVLVPPQVVPVNRRLPSPAPTVSLAPVPPHWTLGSQTEPETQSRGERWRTGVESSGTGAVSGLRCGDFAVEEEGCQDFSRP